MKNTLIRNSQMILRAVGGAVLFSIGSTVTFAEESGAVEALTGYNVNETSWLKNNGFVVGGWANAGITYNATNSRNGFNGTVTFNDRDSEVQLNQLNLFVQRAVATEGSSWDIGGRFDVLFGTDAVFTQAYGAPATDINTGAILNRNSYDLTLLNGSDNRFYDLALPQAYLETYIPVGNGLNVKIGHFYTPIGYEVVTAPDNFFQSHAYTFQYGEPFTHTGILGNYTFNDNWSGLAGVVTGSATGGWDGGFDRQLGNFAGIGGATWTSTDKATSANVAGTFGTSSETSNQIYSLYSIVLKHDVTQKTHLVLQHDHGFADGVLTAAGGHVAAEWYGINSELFYDINDELKAGFRGEWFRDQNGFRVFSPQRIASGFNARSGSSYAGNINDLTGSVGNGASYYEFSAGINWKPKKWINLRPQVRYDFVDSKNGIVAPFANGKKDQFLFSTDVVVSF
ncbi:MAG: porin [Methylococcaceae bacterium]